MYCVSSLVVMAARVAVTRKPARRRRYTGPCPAKVEAAAPMAAPIAGHAAPPAGRWLARGEEAGGGVTGRAGRRAAALQPVPVTRRVAAPVSAGAARSPQPQSAVSSAWPGG